MSTRDELIARTLDGTIEEVDISAIREEMGRDPDFAAEIADVTRIDRLLRFKAYLDRETPDLVVGVLTRFDFSDQKQEAFQASVNRTIKRRVPGRLGKFIRFVITPLAAAASLAIVAGVWWFIQRPAGLGLRVAEVAGTATIENEKLSTGGGSAFGGKMENWGKDTGGGGQGSVAGMPASGVRSTWSKVYGLKSNVSPQPLTVGMQLRQGDRLVVKAGGRVGLKYVREATTIGLESATATFGAEKGGKRVKLEAGRFVCTAVPQRIPLRIDTPHAIAEVVGTHFWLGVTEVETTLAVQAGKVALRQKEQSLEVSAGETAVADAAGLRKLSPGDAWIRDLLVRAETGPWDVVNLGTGLYSNGVWRMDARGGPAERRIWNMPEESHNLAGMVTFRDGKRWARGVLTGRMMLLPEGQAALDVGDGVTTPAIGWIVRRFRLADESGVWQKSRKAAVTLGGGRPPEREINNIIEILKAGEHQAGVWYRFAVYLDMETPQVLRVVHAAWPEGSAMPLPASKWGLKRLDSEGDGGRELGLMAKGVLMVAQGLKFVPLGPEVPMPPAVGEGK